MENSLLILVLALVTMVAVIGIGLHQINSVARSQEKRGEKPGGLAGPEPD